MIILRPHHLIDIIRNIGQQRPVVPHPYGHAQHLITTNLIINRDEEVVLTVGADDLCLPCIHLDANGRCNDLLPQFPHRVLKQNYNDELDLTIMNFLHIEEGTRMTFLKFIELIETNLEDLVPICSHPGESISSRREGLIRGIMVLRHPPGL